MTSEKWDTGEIALGIALISPLDEIAAGVVSGGASTPTAPLQGAISALIGFGLILHGAKVIK